MRITTRRTTSEERERVPGRPAGGWWQRRDATEDELARAMPGDDIVQAPAFESTSAITIHARPAEIWPWLVRIGRGRGALLGVDWLDRLLGVRDALGADRVLPGRSELRPGDASPAGKTAWPVRTVDRERSLVLRVEEGDALVSQSWGLYAEDAETTRLVVRVRGSLPAGRSRVLLALLASQELLAVRAQLPAIASRAESLARARRGAAGGVS